MRTLKFRAWYKPHLEKGIIQKFIQKEIDDKLYFVAEDDDEIRYEFYIPFIDDDWLIEQYTSITDKNGDEVCEGDIIQSIHQKIKLECCRFLDWSFRSTCPHLELIDKDNPDDLYDIDINEWEVIGNIHEKEKII